MTLAAVLGRMGRDDLTVHGFRSTFRDWAGETTAHPREVIEAALAHQLKDKAEAAYARGDLFVKRRKLMEDWAAFLAKAPGEVLTMPGIGAGAAPFDVEPPCSRSCRPTIRTSSHSSCLI